ncbi:hypothetical protein WME76_17130 [Sorangium sp. So ce119]|uniref:hypothetical protein n=1 Tax=Sorangium sp. So ce119 TaxID=3133279 RepID=UPI003F5DEE4B
MAADKAMLDSRTSVTRGPTASEPGPRTHDARAIAEKRRYFEGLKEWQELFAVIDRKDPNMRRGR